MSEKKVVSRNVAIALGIICIILAVALVGAVANYTSIMSEKDNVFSLLLQDNNRLNIELNDWIMKCHSAEDDLTLLRFQYSDYVASHKHTNEEYEDAKFSFYYVNKPDAQKFGVEMLASEIKRLKFEEQYQEGVFDCSEMSANLEWWLENNGWHAKIIVGDCPFSSGYHAWLLVETSNGKYMPIEATTIEVVWWEDSNFYNYFKYDHCFETIQEALAYSETSFDWWNS